MSHPLILVFHAKTNKLYQQKEAVYPSSNAHIIGDYICTKKGLSEGIAEFNITGSTTASVALKEMMVNKPVQVVTIDTEGVVHDRDLWWGCCSPTHGGGHILLSKVQT